MSIGLQHKYHEGVFYLSGAIDEHVKLEVFTCPGDKIIRWNLRGVDLLNSLGIRTMVKFFTELGSNPIELYDCPTPFLEAANVIPGMVGGAKNSHRVKSIYLPMRCADFHKVNASIPVKDISFTDDIAMPIFDCPTCKMPLEPDFEVDLEDLLFFLFE